MNAAVAAIECDMMHGMIDLNCISVLELSQIPEEPAKLAARFVY